MNPSGSIHVVETYGHLRLHCGEEEYARIRKLIYAETAVADAVKTPECRVRSIRITAEPVSEGPTIGWFALIPTLIASCLNGAIIVVGLVTIFRWIMERVS